MLEGGLDLGKGLEVPTTPFFVLLGRGLEVTFFHRALCWISLIDLGKELEVPTTPFFV